MKTICWVQHASEWEAFIPIAKQLKKKDYCHIFVCKTQRAYEKYLEAGFTAFFVPSLINDKKFDFKQIAKSDDKYGAPFISDIYASDVHLWFLFDDYKNAAPFIHNTYNFWEQLFAEHQVDYVIMRETATFLTRTAYNAAKVNNIPYAQLTLGPGPGYTVLYNLEEYHQWSELLEAGKHNLTLTTEEADAVDDFVEKRVPKSQAGMRMRFVPISFLQAVKNYLSLCRADTTDTLQKDPIRVAALRYGRFRLRKQLAWKYITQYFFQYDQFEENDQFVYFPIYSGLETSYLSHTPFWALNEVSLIKMVAQSLPQGTCLYVKEHPHNPGDLTFRELRSLQKLSNVKIVRPEISSQFLIEQSDLVCVLEGTAGWEAFLSTNKVLTIGRHAFYAESPLVFKSTDINRLSKDIKNALEADNPYQDQSAWYKFIHTVISTSGRGDVVNLQPPYGFASDQQSVSLVADYIARTIKSRTQDSTHKF